jgi:hypothetical protein
VLLRQAAERRQRGGAGICENDIDASHLIVNPAVEAVEIGRLGDVALDWRRARSEKRGGRLEFRLPAAREVNAHALRKPWPFPGRSQSFHR